MDFKCIYFCFPLKLLYSDISTPVCSLLCLPFAVCPCFLQIHEYPAFPVVILVWYFIPVHVQCVRFETLLLSVLPSDQFSLTTPLLLTKGLGYRHFFYKNQHQQLPSLHGQSSSSVAKFHVNHLTVFFKFFRLFVAMNTEMCF